jgi:hypothetical protein
MYNLHNLNDVEFESLCKDIMERITSTNLRCFSKGKDGGIDLTDNIKKSNINYNIIVQVKHYINSTFSNLRTSLENEKSRIKTMKPKKYYICCSKDLTPDNIREIYNMFSDYMESDKNIITLIEINDFLEKSENSDIVKKHYKLWLYASGILSQIFNQNIFIDCESLLCDIEEESKYFVQTEVYNQCLKILDKHRIIMITGQPGVGKTVTSKMLVLFYATLGYSVRYTTNGDISDIKKSLSGNKEVILLDDCLGQHYFKMKETQENELTSLIKFIKFHENKILILNSRLTILNETKERNESFKLFLEKKYIDELTINMDTITHLEKAKIFYNHLIYKNIPKEYYENIKEEKNYLKIVMHKNYTPRIIDNATLPLYYLRIPTKEFAQYILKILNNPKDIWKDEYYQRIKEEDRLFLTTLYSLTDTIEEYNILKKSFYKRIENMINIDYTINIFESILARLNQSFVKIVDFRGEKHIGVINPSVNDFLRPVILENELETQAIIKSATYYKQLKRCSFSIDISQILDNMFDDGSIFNIDFESDIVKKYFITSYICIKKILDSKYQEIVHQYLLEIFGYELNKQKFLPPLLSHEMILNILLRKPFYVFYHIDNFFYKHFEKEFFDRLELNELVSTINILDEYFNENKNKDYFRICNIVLKDAIENYILNISISEYCENYPIEEYLSKDKISIHDTVKNWIYEDINREIFFMLDKLNNEKLKNIIIPKIDIDTSEIYNIIDSYSDPKIIKEDNYVNQITQKNNFEFDIENIFER